VARKEGSASIRVNERYFIVDGRTGKVLLTSYAKEAAMKKAFSLNEGMVDGAFYVQKGFRR
jgi:hypothetical protein